MTETAGDVSQSEDEDKDALSQGIGAEAPESREERKEEPVHKEVHTPPAKTRAKMLTRLGSLESQYIYISDITLF